jgi:NTE family protein
MYAQITIFSRQWKIPMAEKRSSAVRTGDTKSVSLVLGSGGARGLAHIGVIRCLQELGYDIRSISGSSMGALVGGIYAAGKLDEYEKWVSAITKLDIIAMLDFSVREGGLVKGEKIINTLRGLVGDCLIEELPISFTAVAVDLNREKEVWFNTGSLFDAIRASISIPLFFTPFKYKSAKLIDGGVQNPVPIAPTFGDDTDITIAVNLNGRAEDLDYLDRDDESDSNESQSFKERVSVFIESLTQAKKSNSEDELNFYTVASKAIEAMQSTITRHKLATYPPDQIIDIPRNVCEALEFDQSKRAIRLGYYKTRAVISQLQDRDTAAARLKSRRR